MTEANTRQIAEWNGALGQRWAERQRELELMVEPFSHAVLDAAAPRSGERVLDVGCGCGASSLALARSVGSSGHVLGIDVSQPMLEVARAHAGGLPQLAYLEGDAAGLHWEQPFDLLFSRFGLMFFDAPAAALRHLHAALGPRGRLAFVCWRHPRDNAWAMAPLAAARSALGIVPPPWDPLAPGPFAFADGDRVQQLLHAAGFDGIAVRRVDAQLQVGATPAAAAAHALRIGPASHYLREVGAQHEPAVLAAITAALTPLAAADGSVRLGGSVWVVTALRGG